MLRSGDFAAAHAMAADAVALGERCGEADLIAVARHVQGRAAIKLGQVSQGIKLLDETMLAVVAGELSPIITGFMYCSVIDACRGVYELRRAREWTAALSRWCDRQAGMVAFTDICFVHRAEILCLQGAWQDALVETRRVCERAEDCDRVPPGGAFYQQGEIHRLRGEATLAEECYRAASRRGFDPQPGLALLRLAQGRTDAASAAIRRLLGATSEQLDRARLLPAHFEIMLAIGDLEEAQRTCEELESLRAAFESEVLHAQAAQARGALCARNGDAVRGAQVICASRSSSGRRSERHTRQRECGCPSPRFAKRWGIKRRVRSSSMQRGSPSSSSAPGPISNSSTGVAR